MGKKSILTAFTERLEKNRLIRTVVIGAVVLSALLLFLTSGTLTSCGNWISERTETTQQEEKQPSTQAEALEKRLESILSTIEGVGRVKVMLTLGYPEENELSAFGTAAGGGKNAQTVCGVIVAAEGAGSISVRLNIIAAVSTALGVDQNLVEVFVMAGQR